METVNFIAELWGFFMATAALSLILRQRIISKLFLFAEEEINVFCSGLLSFLVGLATVLNVAWANNWKVVLSILGWLAIIKGATHLFLPKLSKKIHSKIEDKDYFSYALLAVLFIGLFLIYAGFKM